MRFASSLSGGFITAIEVNPPERKLAKCTSVECTIYKDLNISFEAVHIHDYVI